MQSASVAARRVAILLHGDGIGANRHRRTRQDPCRLPRGNRICQGVPGGRATNDGEACPACTVIACGGECIAMDGGIGMSGDWLAGDDRGGEHATVGGPKIDTLALGERWDGGCKPLHGLIVSDAAAFGLVVQEAIVAEASGHFGDSLTRAIGGVAPRDSEAGFRQSVLASGPFSHGSGEGALGANGQRSRAAEPGRQPMQPSGEPTGFAGCGYANGE